jgi:S1-C subfamily serine protease
MANVLQNLSDELAGLVQALDPSVVRVEARRRLPATGIVWSADGLIVTSHHVVERNKDIKIGLSDGRTVAAELVGRDPGTDIALLKVSGTTLTAPTWGESSDLHVGNLVLALGRPAEHVLATLGVVSALEGAWKTRAGAQLEHYLQTDVVMYPGFSGGPLVGADNKVLGLNTSALSPGISLTITAPTLRRVVEALSTYGHIRRGFLGVGVQPVALPAAVAESRGQKHGLLVVSVEADSPAEKGGLVLGDTLLTLDGQAIQEVDELLALLVGDRVGRDLTAQILRAGEIVEKRVTVGERE